MNAETVDRICTDFAEPIGTWLRDVLTDHDLSTNSKKIGLAVAYIFRAAGRIWGEPIVAGELATFTQLEPAVALRHLRALAAAGRPVPSSAHRRL